MTTSGKTSDSAVDTKIRAYDPTFATTTNNTVYCYDYEIPDVVPVSESPNQLRSNALERTAGSLRLHDHDPNEWCVSH
jgi:hypothetical protein